MNGPRLLTLAFALLALPASGCNLAGLLIKGTADSASEFTEERGTHFADPEMVGPVIAAATVTNEGLLYFVDDYEPLLRSAIFANVAYGVAWLGEDAHVAEIEGRFEDAERYNKRAGILFARALFYAKKLMRLRDDGFDDALGGGMEAFEPWVNEYFYEKEDAETLLVVGMAFLVSMIESEDGLAAAVDLPFARYMIERSIQLDPEFNGGQGMMFIGTIECTMPEAVGGKPRLGLRLMQKAAKIDNRQNHSILVAIAERCAVALQDRKMFVDTLMEIIEAGDVEEFRLTNKMARHHAEHLLKQIDEFFYD